MGKKMHKKIIVTALKLQITAIESKWYTLLHNIKWVDKKKTMGFKYFIFFFWGDMGEEDYFF